MYSLFTLAAALAVAQNRFPHLTYRMGDEGAIVIGTINDRCNFVPEVLATLDEAVEILRAVH